MGGSDSTDSSASMFGGALILLYVLLDSFTSNWQHRVFKEHPNTTPIQMLYYSNLFAWLYMLTGLWLASEISPVAHFLWQNPSCVHHIALMASCSAAGQLVIMETIKRFGPAAVATIQTVRQMLSVVVSILFFQHPVNTQGIASLLLVFAALIVQVIAKSR